MGFLFVPLTTLTNDPIPKEEIGNATSLFNLMRNIGASIGIATVTTLVARHSQVHTNTLGAHLSVYNPQTQAIISRITSAMIARGADAATATHQAYAFLAGMVGRQAAIMSYNDVFAVLTLLFASMLPLVFLMRKPKQAKPGKVAMH